MKKLAIQYQDKPPIATLPLTNFGGLGILDVHYEYGESYVIVAFFNGSKAENFSKHRLRTTKDLRQFFRKGNCNYYIDQFIRV